MTEVVEKPEDAALDAMNATLRRMHATKPTPHKSITKPDIGEKEIGSRSETDARQKSISAGPQKARAGVADNES